MPRYDGPLLYLINEWEEGEHIYSFSEDGFNLVRISKNGNEFRAYRYCLNTKQTWDVSVDLGEGTRIKDLLDYVLRGLDHA